MNNDRTSVKDMMQRLDEQTEPMMKVPPRLKSGARIGVVAPSSAFDPEYVARAIDYLREKGYKVELGNTVRNVLDKDLTAANDQARADDVMLMFADKGIDAIFTATGGYGSIRAAKLLDFDLIRKNPKIFVGFSDTTGILNIVTMKCGFVTFVGPSLELGENDVAGEDSLDAFLEMVSKPVAKFDLTFPQDLSFVREIPCNHDDKPREGTLFGGNLSLISRMVGTPYCIPKDDIVLALEEIGEPAFDIDSNIQQLSDAGILTPTTPIILGEFTRIANEYGDQRKEEEAEASVSGMLRQRFSNHKAPVLYGYPFSHGQNWNMALPIGARVRVDPKNLKVTVLNPVVG